MKRIVVIVCGLFFVLPILTLAEDRMELGETSIVGAQELPKVLYVVPWKDTEISVSSVAPDKDSSGINLDVLDREVFRREISYYDLLNPGAAAPR